MTNAHFDQDFWQQLWTKTLRDHGDKVASRPTNAYVTAEFATLAPGRALDAGCGHGAESLWLAAHGWQVTAVDFSPAALEHGRGMARALGADVAARITWSEGDLARWSVPSERFDLVICRYVHIASSVGAMVRRMASAVAPGCRARSRYVAIGRSRRASARCCRYRSRRRDSCSAAELNDGNLMMQSRNPRRTVDLEARVNV